MPDQIAAPVSVIIPARNEAATIARVVATMRAMDPVAEVVVIDNASSDATAAQAEGAGARVTREVRPGMGHAVRRGVAVARHDWVMKVDADLGRFDTALFARMAEAREEGVGLVKGAWSDPQDPMPMTRLLVAPALRLMAPGLGHLRAPNSGIYLFDRSLIAHGALTGDYAVDLDVMLRVQAAGAQVAEVDIGRIVHDARNPDHYARMAGEILAFFLSRPPLAPLEEVVVLAAREAAVIRHAIGVIAAKVICGARVTVCLDEGGGAGLCDLLAAFPTFGVVSLDQAGAFSPHANATALRVIAPADGPARAAAEAIVARTALPVTLWEMPAGAGWTPDTGVDPGAGEAIRRAALGRLDPGVEPPAREVFRQVALRRP